MAVSGVGGVAGQLGGQISASSARTGGAQLTPDAQSEVNRLKAIDSKVRAHEQAHMSAGAGLTGGASYQYVRGPDGRQYAVAGEVTINVSPAQTPQATIERARQVEAAALAPADPSPQDHAVAAAAALLANQARAELSEQKRKEATGESSTGGTSSQRAAGLRAYAARDATPALIDQYA